MEGRYEFVSPEWDEISDHAKHLISHLLVTNPQRRLTATEALAHPFLQIQPVDFKVFSAKRRFKGVICCLCSLRFLPGCNLLPLFPSFSPRCKLLHLFPLFSPRV